MKKVFLGLMALVTFAMVGCKGGDGPTPPPPPPPTPQEDVPEVSAPAADKMLLLIRVDKEENKKVCNGVAIRGAMTEYGSGSPILFTKVENTETWYKAEMPAYDNVQFFHCKVLIAAEDGSASYDHEAKEGAYEFIEGYGTENLLEIADDYGTANCLNVIEGAQVGGKVLYVHVGGFKGSPCVAKSSYKITLKMAYAGDDAPGPAISGSFNSWGITAMDKVNDAEWTVTVEAQEGNEYKFQGGNGGWSNEIEEYTVDPETSEGSWNKQGNKQLGSELEVVFDYTDATKYRWSKSTEPPVVPGEPKIITVKFKLPADWTNTPTVWVWPTGGEGVAADLTQDGAWWAYTTPEAVEELNIIVRNGSDWSGGQTVDIKTSEDACYQIGENEGNREVTAIDCE